MGWLLTALAAATLQVEGTPAAKLGTAIGPVETRPTAEAAYAPLAPGQTIPPGSWIRTPARSKAVFECPDGTELRVDENTELQLSVRRIELAKGRFQIRVPDGPAFSIKTRFSPMEMTSGLVEISFRERAPDEPPEKTPGRTVTQITCLDGVISVVSRRYTQKLTPGYVCYLFDGQLNTPDPCEEPALASAWLHELLLARDPRHPEMRERFQTLLRLLGGTRFARAEEVVRATGSNAAPYLAEHLKAPPGPLDTDRRRRAATLLAELASAGAAADLVEILKDGDPEVRVRIAAGLERLAGANLGFDAAYWRGSDTEKGRRAWQDWVRNRK
ncbi:MAG TPA: FecR domain-containing protein [Planctomycetota bacterium]|nr:FecR domain-containing protein [Planctomycetota bacterium]